MLEGVHLDKIKSLLPESTTVRLWQSKDLPFVSEAIEALGPEVLGYHHHSWLFAYEQPKDVVLVAEVNGRPVGFAAADLVFDPRPFILFHSAMVHPDFQRRGIGTLLVLCRMTYVHYHLDHIQLETTKDGLPFYMRFGFTPAGDFSYNQEYDVSLCALKLHLSNEVKNAAWQILKQIPQLNFTLPEEMEPDTPGVKGDFSFRKLLLVIFVTFMAGAVLSWQIRPRWDWRNDYLEAENLQQSLVRSAEAGNLESRLKTLSAKHYLLTNDKGERLLLINDRFHLRVPEDNTNVYIGSNTHR